jgi:voltage-gated sodium channel
VAGVHLFATADPEDFGNLPAALFTLFQIVTLDNWGEFFNRASEKAPVLLVSAYFISFIVLGTMIILNLFIGIVMNSMAEMHKELEDAASGTTARKTPATLDADLENMERQLIELQSQLRAMRRRASTPEAAINSASQP